MEAFPTARRKTRDSHAKLPFPTTTRILPSALSPLRLVLGLLLAAATGFYLLLPSTPPTSSLPLPAALATGTWLPNRRITSNASVLAAWGAPPTCPGGGPERGVAVSRYEWHPETPLAPWDSLSVLTRFLNSPRGLVLVGDSVTTQSYEALEGLIQVPSKAFPRLNESVRVTHSDDFNIRKISVVPLSPLHIHLMAVLPHVPLPRLLKPFITVIRHDTLIPVKEITVLAQQLKLVEKGYEPKPWLLGREWEAVVRKKFGMLGSEDKWDGVRKSVLLLNTGAHWSRASFGPGLGKEGVQALYSSMVQTLLPRLPPPSFFHVIYRTTSPTHEDCGHRLSPLAATPQPEENSAHLDWDWATFGALDDIWRRELQGEGGRVLLDVGEMAGKRPDGHIMHNPDNADCLHWCLPTIPGTWIRMVWTLVVREDEVFPP